MGEVARMKVGRGDRHERSAKKFGPDAVAVESHPSMSVPFCFIFNASIYRV